MSEKEPNLNISEKSDNLESALRRKGFHIDRAQLPKDEPIQCDSCMKEDRFEFYNEGWFIEGQFYCGAHKEHAINVLKDIADNVDEIRKEREEIEKKRS